jgi:hypothetical protein
VTDPFIKLEFLETQKKKKKQRSSLPNFFFFYVTRIYVTKKFKETMCLGFRGRRRGEKRVSELGPF